MLRIQYNDKCGLGARPLEIWYSLVFHFIHFDAESLNKNMIVINPSGTKRDIPGNLGQYHCCWCSKALRRQVISSYDV